MNRKKWLIPIWVIVAILLVCVLTVATLISKGYGASTGLYLESKDGAAILICNNSPIVMASNHNGDMFYDLEVGDRIFVIHTGIEESYPGQTTARAVFKLSSGDAGDIPDAVINSLIELGWLDPVPADRKKQNNEDPAAEMNHKFYADTEVVEICIGETNFRFDKAEDVESICKLFEGVVGTRVPDNEEMIEGFYEITFSNAENETTVVLTGPTIIINGIRYYTTKDITQHLSQYLVEPSA